MQFQRIPSSSNQQLGQVNLRCNLLRIKSKILKTKVKCSWFKLSSLVSGSLIGFAVQSAVVKRYLIGLSASMFTIKLKFLRENPLIQWKSRHLMRSSTTIKNYLKSPKEEKKKRRHFAMRNRFLNKTSNSKTRWRYGWLFEVLATNRRQCWHFMITKNFCPLF